MESDETGGDAAMPTMQAIETEPRGTWWQRLLIAIFSLALTLLFFWALGFILQDIGRLPGPDWSRLSGDRLDPVMAATTTRLQEEQAGIKRKIENEERRRQVLRDSTATSQKTLGQLLELQRMSLEQQTSLPEEQQQALVESQRVFLANQQRDQDLTESISDHQERQAAIAEELRQHLEQVNLAQTPLREEYQRLQTSHRLRLAAIKIGVLAPLLVLAGLLFARFRNSPYAPMVYAFGAAVLARAFFVMHEYFPAEYFRYILIATALAVIAWLLARLLQLVARPGGRARQKQIREAYESFVCPGCRFPIRRGPLRFMAWTPRSLRRVSRPLVGLSDEPYACPSCGLQLFTACSACKGVRHTLLPACEHCGVEEEPAG
jgi:predicted RNA-binding Zn-ribbon protein involved in translation (DUF1610 family)